MENQPQKLEFPARSAKPWRSGVIPVLLFILVILLSALGYLLYQNQQLKKMLAGYQVQNSPSPTPVTTINPTSDWKTYTDGEYGFTFKYPSEFKYLVKESGSNGDFKQILALQNFPRTNMPDYSNNATFQMLIYVKKDTGDNFELNRLIPSRGGAGAFMHIAKNGNVYLIDFLLNKTGDKDLYNQILSTFKFLDKVSETPNVTSPLPNSKVTSPLTITGTSPWMFEGQFPIKIVDSKRNIIAQGTAKEVTPGSWTTGSQTPFTVTLPFSTEDSSGFIILSADNPSGLPQNDKTFEIPVKF